MKKVSALWMSFICAALFCLGNAFKPAVVDDVAYLWYARQIVESPAHPFGPPPEGFKLIWYDRGAGAFSLLMPMVVPYWLAAGISLFGENLVCLKLWLFPFCWLFTSGLQSLSRRYAPGCDRSLLVFVVISPVFLPSLNLMVDVPATALLVSGIAVFHKALDLPRTNWRFVMLAGLLCGLATQTKYTGLVGIPVILLLSILRRRWLAGLSAILIAILVFAGWEAYLTKEYGHSHFLLHLNQRRAKPNIDAGQNLIERMSSELYSTLEKKAMMAPAFMGALGSAAAGLIPLMLLALRYSRKTVFFAIGCLSCGYLLMMFVPSKWAIFYQFPHEARDEVSIGSLFFGLNAFMITVLLCAVMLQTGLRKSKRSDGASHRETKSNRLYKTRLRWGSPFLFLIGWLILEMIGSIALSPFAAVRRVMGVMIAAPLLAGRLVALTAKQKERPSTLQVVCAWNAVLGILFAITDFRDAVAERNALLRSVALIRIQPDGNRPIWFCGHWGFQYYAELEGLSTIFPEESEPEEGDWIIYPDVSLRPYSQLIFLEPEWAQKQLVLEQFDDWPLRTNPEYYMGAPSIRHHEGPRLRITVFRVKKKFLAQPT